MFALQSNMKTSGTIPRWCTTVVRLKLLAIVMTLSGVCCDAVAQLPRIRLTSVSPASLKVGGTTTVTIAGDLSEAATELVFSHPGIAATQQIVAPSEYGVATRKQRVFDVVVAEDVPDGRYEVRALGGAGISGPRFVLVSKLAQHTFDATSNSRQQAFSIEPGSMTAAVSRNEQRDWYRFHVNELTPLLVQVWADRIDSRMDAALSVYHAESGRRVAHVRQGMSRDPVVTFRPVESGDYLVEVHDTTFRGGGDYPYVLEVSRRAVVQAAHPVVARAGVETEFTLFGHNLPGGSMVSGHRDGLQSLEVRFAPDFDATHFAGGLAIGSVAAARVSGGSVQLPAPLADTSVFLARAGDATENVTREEAQNDSLASAQPLNLPSDVAGQFYPRHDADWYRFEATKGQVLWVDVETGQLGTNSDPVLRILRAEKKNGAQVPKQLAVADDVEGPPNSRDSRRLHTGTSDSSIRFKVPEDGTYFIHLRDQFNAADDPRQVYRLSLRTARPDYQLVALANPERHADEKIVKPNGVSLIPGGAAAIRVRLLPQHGFVGDVAITAQSLPQGVSAHPLKLNSRSPEGLLVLTATRDARPEVAAIQLLGTPIAEGDARIRYARYAAIRRDVNNVDATPTSARLMSEMLVAVVDAPPIPISVRRPGIVRASRGAKLKLPVQLLRTAGWKDREIEVAATALPSQVKVPAVKTKSDTAEVTIELNDAKLKPGSYQFPLTLKLREQRPRNDVEFREATASESKIQKLLEARELELKKAADGLAAATAVVSKLDAERQAKFAVAEEPRSRLQEKLKAEEAAAQALVSALSEAAQSPGSRKAELAVASAEENLRAARAERTALRASLATSLSPLDDLLSELTAKRADEAALRTKLEAIQKKRDDANAKLVEAKKRVADVRKAQMEKEVDYWSYSAPLTLDVVSSPLSLQSPATLKGTPGEPIELPVLVDRQFGFDGQVHLEVEFPDSQLVAAPLVLGPGQRVGRLVVATTNEVGEWKGKINSLIRFNGVEIRDSVACTIVVAAKEE